MKVLVLAPHDYYVERGTPIDTDLLVRALSAGGHQVDLVVYRGGVERGYPGVTIHRADTPRWLKRIGPGFSWKKVVSDLWLFNRARKLMRESRYDVVHAGEEAVYFALWFRWRNGVPYIYDMDSAIAQQMVEAMPRLRPLSRFFNWCEAKAVRGALAAAPVCRALADLAHERGAHHVVTLYDISQLDGAVSATPAGFRERLGVKGLLLVYAGNFEPYQGVHLLLQALALALEKGASVDLLLAGGMDRHFERYRRQARTLGIEDRAHFVGPWPAARLGELLAEADIVVSPRTTGINTPMKVFPYLHSGKPLLATDIRSHNQVLGPEVAYLAAPEPEAFARAILELCERPELREQLGVNGRAFVERNHTYPAHQARVDELYGYVRKQLAVPEGRADRSMSAG